MKNVVRCSPRGQQREIETPVVHRKSRLIPISVQILLGHTTARVSNTKFEWRVGDGNNDGSRAEAGWPVRVHVQNSNRQSSEVLKFDLRLVEHPLGVEAIRLMNYP